jgi:hypothetical protein
MIRYILQRSTESSSSGGVWRPGSATATDGAAIFFISGGEGGRRRRRAWLQEKSPRPPRRRMRLVYSDPRRHIFLDSGPCAVASYGLGFSPSRLFFLRAKRVPTRVAGRCRLHDCFCKQLEWNRTGPACACNEIARLDRK